MYIYGDIKNRHAGTERKEKMTTIKKTTAKKMKKSKKKSDIKPYRLGDYAGIGYHSGTTRSGGSFEQRVANAIIDCYGLRPCSPTGKRKLFAAPFPDGELPDDCIIKQYPYKKLKGGSRYGRQDFVCNCNGMSVGIECKNQNMSGTADEKTYYALENISRQYKQNRRILILGGKAWAPEIVADLKAKAARREYCALHPEVDVIVATEQEFFEEILPRMFEPMTAEQRSFNEQVAIIERNRQSAIAAQQSAFEAALNR